MKLFTSIATIVFTLPMIFVEMVALPAHARCGDGLKPDPSGGNFCVPEDPADSDAIFRLCSARVEHYRKISIQNGWSDRMDPAESMKSCLDSRGKRF